MLAALKGDLEPETVGWFEVDKQPDRDCVVCDGTGFIGHFANAKVIPCTCIFNTRAAWALAVKRQRELGRASRDKGLNVIRRE